MSNKTILEAIEECSLQGKLPKSEVIRIANEYRVSLSQVESLASFYCQDDTKDKICVGLPCSLKRTELGAGPSRNDGFQRESCLGYCDRAPVLRIGGKYVTQKWDSFAEIEESQENYVLRKRQTLEEYLARGGYSAFEEIAASEDPSRMLDLIEKADLRGMGGAGFPVFLKWKSFRENRTADSSLLVNAHEGEPGTFKDRIIMEQRPHELIEGAMIAASSNNIGRVVIAIKKEYKLAIKSVRLAIDEMVRMFAGGKKDTFLPEISVITVAGTYVTGEETALMEAIEGKRSEPRVRPPFPTERGLFDKPTLVHNVETLAAISAISRSGRIQVVKNYCLTGDVAKPGMYPVEMGVSVKELVEKHGGTGMDGTKAVMVGGLSGGMVPSSASANMGLSFDALRKAGGGLGTGAVIVLSKDRCTVDTTKVVSAFFRSESCGKCTPCRYGTAAIDDILCRVVEGTAIHEDLERGREIAKLMIDGSICALGQVAGKSFLDLMKYFDVEVEDHLRGFCSAGICRMRQ